MNTPPTGKPLKSANLPWLISLVVFDIIIVVAFVYPALISSSSASELTIARAMVTLVLPVVVLLLTGLLPHNIKASLVYWKVTDVLPAHEAFTKHALSDARVDMAALRADVGELPTIPNEQNRLWFKLYKATENAPTVLEAHKMYLLYRDMAAISFLLFFSAPIGFYLSGFGRAAVLATAGIFALQYLIAAISARHSGIRFVTNVMSIHSATPTTVATKSPSTKKKTSSPKA
jgi:hypothetical protein